MKTTIVIPTYNEKENLPILLERIFGLNQNDLHILIVDDSSPDGTGELAEELKEKYAPYLDVFHRPVKNGLGRAYVEGFAVAINNGADIIGHMDADFSHPIEKIPAMIEAAVAGKVAVGSRYVKGGSVDEKWPIWRKALSRFGSFYSRTILGINLNDVTGGYKFWPRAMLAAIPMERIRSGGYVFQVEMNYLAYLLGAEFCEIPIYFAERVAGISKMSFKIQMEAAIQVWLLPSRYKDIRKRL
ncbi:MAG: polyprenol monophosphomannose synthase [Anaerolineaceae bacterium]|nr:polyprenol monophosphomannose synthase [Anaerolineaceae bacterium]